MGVVEIEDDLHDFLSLLALWCSWAAWWSLYHDVESAWWVRKMTVSNECGSTGLPFMFHLVYLEFCTGWNGDLCIISWRI